MEGVIVLSNNKPLLTSHFVRPHLANLAIDAFLSAKRAQPLSLQPVIYFDAYPVSSAVAGPSSSSKGKGKQRSRQAPLGDAYEVESDEEDSESESSNSEESEEEDILENDGWRAAGGDNSSLAQEPNGSTSTTRASRYACCHITQNGLHLLAPSRGDSDPSIAFAYLHSLLGVLRQYLGGEVTDYALRDNFDIALQLFAETLSAPYPVFTDASALQELVPSSSLLAKILNASLAAASSAQATAASFTGSGTSSPRLQMQAQTSAAPFSSPLHWRRAGIRHPQNEIYFDVNEEIRAIIDKNGNTVSGDVWGRIDCRSKLSGMPDIMMTLSNPGMLDDLSFHPSVRLGRWTAHKAVSFVPPDGEFELLGYRLSQAQQAGIRQANASPAPNVPLPLRIRPVVTLGEVGGSFSISLAPPVRFSGGGIADLEEVTVSLFLGSNAIGVTGSISSASGSSAGIRGGRSSRSSTPVGSTQEKLPPGGKWDFDPLTHTLRWRLANLSPSTSPTLAGTWQFDESQTKSQPGPFVQVAFSAPLSNISGLSIVNLKIEGERYSVYKGFRSNLKGNLEVRW